MKTPRMRPPSAGFGLILLTWVATAGLLAWGFSTPPLHRAWELLTRLNMENASPPSAEEIRAVEEALQRHPEWATALTSGHETALLESPLHGCLRFPVTHLVVRASRDPVPVRLHCPDAPGLRVFMEGAGEIICRERPGTVHLPAFSRPRLVRVRRLAGPPVYPDGRSCPVTLETDGANNDWLPDEDVSPEEGDAAKD